MPGVRIIQNWLSAPSTDNAWQLVDLPSGGKLYLASARNETTPGLMAYLWLVPTTFNYAMTGSSVTPPTDGCCLLSAKAQITIYDSVTWSGCIPLDGSYAKLMAWYMHPGAADKLNLAVGVEAP